MTWKPEFKVTILPSDYSHYGGNVERWENPKEDYPDCTTCKHWLPLAGDLGCDWGICGNKNSPRFSLLTFEHQAGKNCHEY
jgi:hypothetical protein